LQALTELLRNLRLSGGVFLDAEFTEPWCITAQVGPEDCRPYMPPPAHIVGYHYVLQGDLWVTVAEGESLPARAGDLLLLPRNELHRLGSAPGLAPVHAAALIQPAADGGRGPATIRYGGGGVPARLMCGYLGAEDPRDPLLANLPALIRVGVEDALAARWIEDSIRLAARALVRGGADAAASLARLAEPLLAEAIRQYVEALPADASGWLPGLRDHYVARALTLLHGKPQDPWTLETLSRAVGLSRSALSQRFSDRLGVPPMRYLLRRRLQLAAARLQREGDSVARIASDAGYESEAAFARAFKREFGSPPGAFRRAAAEPGRPVSSVAQ
jgi:AraC-like DNA-binding protein